MMKMARYTNASREKGTRKIAYSVRYCRHVNIKLKNSNLFFDAVYLSHLIAEIFFATVVTSYDRKSRRRSVERN